MLDNYFRIIEDGIEVTEFFDTSVISQNIIISKEQVSKKRTHLFYSGFGNITRNQIIYAYSFIYQNSYYILLLDEIINPDPSDEWEGHSFHITTFDKLYIDQCKNKKVYNFEYSWFLKEENSDEMAEYEMEKIRPIIRKGKIKKLLK